jgi:metal-responsive CopG/Arc/MetJ family transcriptional regulator
MEFDKKGIALGSTAEDYKSRKKFIADFYAQWIVENPAKHIYNKSLNGFIEVRYLSMNETSGHASLSYKSTLAVTYLTEILENAIRKGKRLKIHAVTKNYQPLYQLNNPQCSSNNYLVFISLQKYNK